MKYIVKPRACDYAVICIGIGTDKTICTCILQRNAEIIADILNADNGDCYHAYSYSVYPNAKYKIVKKESEE